MKKTIIFTLLILTAFFIGCEKDKDSDKKPAPIIYSFSNEEISLFKNFTDDIVLEFQDLPVQFDSKTSPYLSFKTLFTDYVIEDNKVLHRKGDISEVSIKKINNLYTIAFTENSKEILSYSGTSVKNLLNAFCITSTDLNYIDSYISSLKENYFKVEKEVISLDKYKYNFAITIYTSETEYKSISFVLDKIRPNEYKISYSNNYYSYENIKDIFNNVNWKDDTVSTIYSFSNEEISLFKNFTDNVVLEFQDSPVQFDSKTSPCLSFKIIFTDYVIENNKILHRKGDISEISIKKTDNLYTITSTENSEEILSYSDTSVKNLLNAFCITSIDLNYIDSYISSLKENYFKVEKEVISLDKHKYNFTITIYTSEREHKSISFTLDKTRPNEYKISYSENHYSYNAVEDIFNNVNWEDDTISTIYSFSDDEIYLFKNFTDNISLEFQDLPVQFDFDSTPYLWFKIKYTEDIVENNEIIHRKSDISEISIKKTDNLYTITSTENSKELLSYSDTSVKNLLNAFCITSTDLNYIDSYISSLKENYFKVEKSVISSTKLKYNFTITVYTSDSESKTLTFNLSKDLPNKYCITYSENYYSYDTIEDIFNNINWVEESTTNLKQMIQFYSLDETNYPVKYVRIDGGNYSNQLFFPKEEIIIETGKKYSVTWTYEETSSGNYNSVTRTNEEFRFNGVQITIYLGNTSSLFINNRQYSHGYTKKVADYSATSSSSSIPSANL